MLSDRRYLDCMEFAPSKLSEGDDSAVAACCTSYKVNRLVVKSKQGMSGHETHRLLSVGTGRWLVCSNHGWDRYRCMGYTACRQQDLWIRAAAHGWHQPGCTAQSLCTASSRCQGQVTARHQVVLVGGAVCKQQLHPESTCRIFCICSSFGISQAHGVTITLQVLKDYRRGLPISDMLREIVNRGLRNFEGNKNPLGQVRK